MILIPDNQPYSKFLKEECDHLKPIVELLEKHGNKVDRKTGMVSDIGDGNFILFMNPIDIELINKKVQLPSFIHLREEGVVSCERCWINLEQRKPGKIYNGSKQIIW